MDLPNHLESILAPPNTPSPQLVATCAPADTHRLSSPLWLSLLLRGRPQVLGPVAGAAGLGTGQLVERLRGGPDARVGRRPAGGSTSRAGFGGRVGGIRMQLPHRHGV